MSERYIIDYENQDERIKMKAERRIAARKVVDFIHVAELTSLSNYSVLAHEGVLIDASQSGFLLRLERTQLVPQDLRNNLSMEKLQRLYLLK